MRARDRLGRSQHRITGLEAGLAESAGEAASFVDVSLMAPVPGRGLRTPMLVSGPGATAYADLLAPLGAQVEVVEGPAGEASRRKLLRSVFFKGMAAAVTEAVAAAAAAEMLQELGVPARVSAASRDWLTELRDSP